MGVTGMMVPVRVWRESWELRNLTQAVAPWEYEKTTLSLCFLKLSCAWHVRDMSLAETGRLRRAAREGGGVS